MAPAAGVAPSRLARVQEPARRTRQASTRTNPIEGVGDTSLFERDREMSPIEGVGDTRLFERDRGTSPIEGVGDAHLFERDRGTSPH